MDFLREGVQLFNCMGEENRLKIFTRMRFYYERAADYMKIKPATNKLLDAEEIKLNYVKFMLSSKAISLSAVAFTAKPNFPVCAKTFK